MPAEAIAPIRRLLEEMSRDDPKNVGSGDAYARTAQTEKRTGVMTRTVGACPHSPTLVA